MTTRVVIILANLEGSKKVQNSALHQRGLLAKVGVDITEEQRLELSHRQERHYGVRALREEFDFSQDWLTASARMVIHQPLQRNSEQMAIL